MKYLAMLLALPHTLWVCYVFITAVDRVRAAGGLSRTARVMAAPVLGLGIVLDALTNLTVATVLFLQLPREAFVTQRLKKLVKTTGWRSRLAGWIGGNLLNAFDRTGSHLD
jgi:hypothetical protein